MTLTEGVLGWAFFSRLGPDGSRGILGKSCCLCLCLCRACVPTCLLAQSPLALSPELLP